MVYKAMEVAQPGDVIVIEARGFTTVAHWGDLTSRIARELRLAGMVTDGSVRDLRGICEVGLPVFSRPAVTPNGARKNGPGEVNVPVAGGGVPGPPGDIVIWGAHGVGGGPPAGTEGMLEKSPA